MRGFPCPFVALVLLVVGAAIEDKAQAVEYRLEVANLGPDAMPAFFDGPIGKGDGELRLTRLGAALDAGAIPSGAILYDRDLKYAWQDLARGFSAARVRAEISMPEGGQAWQEARWDGKPGEQSVWVITSSSTYIQEVKHVALEGAAPGSGLRYYIPYLVAARPKPAVAVAYPLLFVRAFADRGTLWERYLSRSVDLADGIAAVVGVNDNPSFSDWVYLIVRHPPEPVTLKAVMGWQRRRIDRTNAEGRNP